MTNWIKELVSGATAREGVDGLKSDTEFEAMMEAEHDRVMQAVSENVAPPAPAAPVQTPFEKANGLLSKVTASLHDRRAKLMADIARDSAELFEVNVVIEAFGNASSIIHVAEATKPGEAVNDAELSAASLSALSDIKIED